MKTLLPVLIAVPLAVFAPAAWSQALDREAASGACMQFIKQRLHDPSSAEFGRSRDVSVTIKGNRAFVVRGVRAKNGFGALRLVEFTCLLEQDGGKISPVWVGERDDLSPVVQSILRQWKFI